MQIKKTDNTIYRIIETSGYQVIGKFATMVLESLDTEYEIITDIAIIDTETNETIYKKSMCNTSPTKELVFKCIEAFLYYIRNDKPDAWTINRTFEKVFEENIGQLFVYNMQNRMKHDRKEAKALSKLEADAKKEKEALQYAEKKGYTITNINGYIYALKFDTEKNREIFLSANNNLKIEVMEKFKSMFTFIKSFPDIYYWGTAGKFAHANMEQLYTLK